MKQVLKVFLKLGVRSLVSQSYFDGEGNYYEEA